MVDTPTEALETGTGSSPERTEILTVTPAARRLLLEVRAAEPSAEELGVRVEAVDHDGAVGYDLSLDPLASAAPSDLLQALDDDLTLMVPVGSVERVRGSTLDVGDGGLVMHQPGAGPAPAPGAIADDPVARRVAEVLADEINPALASHGGHAELVRVEGSVAHVLMSGGCQGCGLAAATLRDGIQAMIIDAVPEITEVVDATDHAAGTAPYYAP